MTDPLNSLEHKRRSARRATGVGVMLFACAAGVLTLLLIVPAGGMGKYVATLAFIAALAGLSMIVNGVIDWWRLK